MNITTWAVVDIGHPGLRDVRPDCAECLALAEYAIAYSNGSRTGNYLVDDGTTMHQVTVKRAYMVLANYSYVIEFSEDGDYWDLADPAAMGTEPSASSAEQYAKDVMDNWVSDHPVAPKWLRVHVWKGAPEEGWQAGTIDRKPDADIYYEDGKELEQ